MNSLKKYWDTGTVLLSHFVVLVLLLAGCREEVTIFLPEHVSVAQPEFTDIEGFYLLCEGNMGWNKATLDYYDYAEGEYLRNIFSYANPTVPKEMGDVGNDLGIYGSNLYCVINCSNKIDVLDKYTCKKKYQINIPNCRFIRFYGGYAYVTSYAGPVQINPNYEQRGYVAKIDTVTMQVVDTCLVGFQPDELEIVEGKIYVANSGGYMVPNYPVSHRCSYVQGGAPHPHRHQPVVGQGRPSRYALGRLAWRLLHPPEQDICL